MRISGGHAPPPSRKVKEEEGEEELSDVVVEYGGGRALGPPAGVNCNNYVKDFVGSNLKIF